MASEPSSTIVGHQQQLVQAEDSDLDAEGEEEDDVDVYHAAELSRDELYDTQNQAEDEDLDAVGEDDENTVRRDDDGHMGAVKGGEDDAEEDGIDEDAAGESDEDMKSEVASNAESDAVTESDPENAWEGESDTGEGVGAEIVEPNQCIFCGQDEEHDPSEEFEDYLACAVCGDNAHRQCARNTSSLGPDDDTERWRCKTCVDNGLEEDGNRAATESSARRRSSGPKVARELLPGHRGAVKPDSHSVFNHLILDDDPMDGSRSLRKRKASDEVEIHQQRAVRKRRRASETVSASAGADQHTSTGSSPRATRVLSSADATVHEEPAASFEDGDSPQGRSIRSRRRKHDKGLCHVVSSEGISLIVSFNLDREKIGKILASRPRKQRARERSRKKIQPPPPPQEPEFFHYPAIQSGFSTQLLAMTDREQDDSKSKPYGGILSEQDADTSKTFPSAEDRKRFEDARLRAEDDWKKKMAALNAQQEITRPSQKISAPPSKIKCINFGGFEIDTWNAAPYPEEYSRNRLLYICEFCLKYMNSDYVAWRHKLKCPAKHPPGDEIYRDGKHSFWEVDGRKNPVYCQNLCLLAKLFLGSKTLYYDVEPFLFYVMTENDEFGCHFVGYFSKEKRPSSMNNVSCILVLPIFQRRGFGHMLIDFSYLLTRTEQKAGSPEKPLSDMGLVSYRGYWRLTLCELLLKQQTPISITQISEETGMTPDDIVSSLEGLRSLIRDPVTRTYALRVDRTYFQEYVEKHARKNYPHIVPNLLIWTPYIMNRGLASHYEDGGPLHAVAPREDDAQEGATQTPPDEGIVIDDTKHGRAVFSNGVTTEESRASGSRSPGHGSRPSTPFANGTDAWNTSTPHRNLVIPAGRFEVFPPVPGMTNRRRSGRPFGSRARHRPSPNHRRSVATFHTGSPGSGARRTRSMLGEEVANGSHEAEGADDHDGILIGFPSRHTEGVDCDDEAAENEEEELERDDEAQAEAEAEVEAEVEADNGADVMDVD